jgi:hypothetical protein
MAAGAGKGTRKALVKTGSVAAARRHRETILPDKPVTFTNREVRDRKRFFDLDPGRLRLDALMRHAKQTLDQV